MIGNNWVYKFFSFFNSKIEFTPSINCGEKKPYGKVYITTIRTESAQLSQQKHLRINDLKKGGALPLAIIKWKHGLRHLASLCTSFLLITSFLPYPPQKVLWGSSKMKENFFKYNYFCNKIWNNLILNIKMPKISHFLIGAKQVRLWRI